MKTFFNHRTSITVDDEKMTIQDGMKRHRITFIILPVVWIILSLMKMYEDNNFSGNFIRYGLILLCAIQLFISLRTDVSKTIYTKEISEIKVKKNIFRRHEVSILHNNKKRNLGVFTSEDYHKLKDLFVNIKK